MLDHTVIQLALRARLLTLSVATTGVTALSATATGYARGAITGTGTVAAVAGVATFSTSQAGVIVNGSTVTVAGTPYIVSAFNGTTGAVLSGAPTFSASAFTRTGSFLLDGFARGMEILAAGFGANGVSVITDVTPTAIAATRLVVTLNADGSRTVTHPAIGAESTASGRSLVAGLPSLQAWENTAFEKVVGHPYVEEQYIPGPEFIANDGYEGLLEMTPMYSPRIFTPSMSGISADGKYADAIRRLFAPGTRMALSSGDVLQVRGDVAPFRGQRGQSDPPGWSVIPITIPLRALTVSSPPAFP